MDFIFSFAFPRQKNVRFNLIDNLWAISHLMFSCSKKKKLNVRNVDFKIPDLGLH